MVLRECLSPEEVCTTGAAAMQYLSGLLARRKRNRSLRKGTPDTCWMRSHLHRNPGEKHGAETSGEPRCLKFYIDRLGNLGAGREQMEGKRQGALGIICALVIQPWLGTHGLQLGSQGSALPEAGTFLGACDPSRRISGAPVRRFSNNCDDCIVLWVLEGIITSGSCMKPRGCMKASAQDTRSLQKMTEQGQRPSTSNLSNRGLPSCVR